MKTINCLIWTLGILIIISSNSCSNKDTIEVRPYKVLSSNTEFTILIIDSCEYIYPEPSHWNGVPISHKGNCSFCAARQRIKDQLRDSLLIYNIKQLLNN